MVRCQTRDFSSNSFSTSILVTYEWWHAMAPLNHFFEVKNSNLYRTYGKLRSTSEPTEFAGLLPVYADCTCAFSVTCAMCPLLLSEKARKVQNHKAREFGGATKRLLNSLPLAIVCFLFSITCFSDASIFCSPKLFLQWQSLFHALLACRLRSWISPKSVSP